jgi:eukaryotic-like serine/threonine-protein kinase
VPDAFPRPFGRYTLLSNLAQGGMGALYLACQGESGMEKLCVIKTVLPHLADKEYVARFRDEAKVVVRLSHGNLAQVFDAGVARGEGAAEELYLAMEHVDGKDLRAVWNKCARKGIAFPVDVAIYIARELARGLHYAHTTGALKLVHRDVSPPNILLSWNGEVKLTDFGLAASTMKTEKTAVGVVYGKVSYMSPEQARAEPLDGRTDMYAVGIILWELLTGRQLFPQSEPQLINRVRDPVIEAPSKFASRVPPAADAIVVKSLMKDRTLRYGDCEGFRAALSSFLAQAAPTTDNDRVAKFLQTLFGEEIEQERSERQALLDALPDWRARVSISQGNVDQTASKPETVSLHKDAPDGGSGLVGTYLDGRYLVKKLIGEGGMGLVYEAEHVEIGRRVAVKVLHAVYTRQAEVVARFRAEARAATRIGNPHIIEVFDSGTTVDGAVYFVMEFLEGLTLSDAIAVAGTLPAARTVAIGRQICQALAAAHKANIVHRDMKPENVFLIERHEREDFVKVLDFGIAKTLDQTGRVGRLTNPGMAMGTPEYMAPEQAAGQPTDFRADIYAVGAILYECLTGRPPHEGANIMEVLSRKATQVPVRVAQLRPDAPPELEQLVMRMIAMQPDQRPASMDVLAQELGRMAGLPAVSAPQMQVAAIRTAPTQLTDKVPRKRTPWVIAGFVAASLVMGATALVINRMGPEEQPKPPANVVVAPVPFEPPKPVVVAPPPVEPPKPAVVAPPVEPPTKKIVVASPVTVRHPSEHKATPPGPPPGPDKRADAKRLIGEARSALQQGRYAQAESLYNQAQATGFEKTTALTGLGDVAFQRGDYAEAVNRARRAVDAGAGISARMLLGNSYFKLKKYDDAIPVYKEVLKLDGNHDEARTNLATAERKRGG